MKKRIGNLVIIGFVILTILVWVVFPAGPADIDHYWRYYIGEIIGSLMLVLMTFSLFISTRPRWAEPYFGGLDKMYVTHRHTSTAAFLLMFVHVVTVPLRVTNLLLGNYLGIAAFLGFAAIILPTLAPRIPFLSRLTNSTYEGWKRLHKFIGIFFVMGFIHSITVDAPGAFVAITYTQVFVIVGTLCYLYAEFFAKWTGRHADYIVASIKHPNNSTTEVTLRPKGKALKARHAGQFLFVRFLGDTMLNETHPFTISSAPHEDVLRITVKACGDFTRHLFHNLKEGSEAVVEGIHGMFNYKTGGQKQIWIAGGIGITPFLSFIRDMKNDALAHDIHFYYTVRHREEAVFLDEIVEAGNRIQRLNPRIRFSATDGSLSMEHILADAGGDVRAHHLYMCGPLPMVQAFEKKFLEAGMPRENIHFEEFNFR